MFPQNTGLIAVWEERNEDPSLYLAPVFKVAQVCLKCGFYIKDGFFTAFYVISCSKYFLKPKFGTFGFELCTVYTP